MAAILETGRGGQPAVKVWDTASGKEVLTLRKQENAPGFRGGALAHFDERLAFAGDGHQVLVWEFSEVPEWSPERGDYTVPAYVRSLWDASPPPEAKK